MSLNEKVCFVCPVKILEQVIVFPVCNLQAN